MKRVRPRKYSDAELDITSFMNLMIILVPVLLLSMVFSHITVLDLKLPNSALTKTPEDQELNKTLELIVRKEQFEVYYPQGFLVKKIPLKDGGYDFPLLSIVLQEIKRLLKDQGIEKRDITILAEKDTSYQTIVSLMDTVRSFQAVVAASLVNAELFPDISIGDAPELTSAAPVQNAAAAQLAPANGGGAK